MGRSRWLLNWCWQNRSQGSKKWPINDQNRHSYEYIIPEQSFHWSGWNRIRSNSRQTTSRTLQSREGNVGSSIFICGCRSHHETSYSTSKKLQLMQIVWRFRGQSWNDFWIFYDFLKPEKNIFLILLAYVYIFPARYYEISYIYYKHNDLYIS